MESLAQRVLHSLMESYRIVKGDGQLPSVREIVLVLGDGKNWGLWKKAKVDEAPKVAMPQVEEMQERPTRRAAIDAKDRIKQCMEDED